MSIKLLATLSLSLLLWGCGGGGDSSRTATIDLSVSDAPVDSAQKVCIAVSGISLHRSSQGNQAEKSWSSAALLNTDEDDDCTPDDSSIPDANFDGYPDFVYIDLLKYQGGDARALLTGEVIPAGSYQQLRLQVRDGSSQPSSYVLNDKNERVPLRVPSDVLKLHGFDVAADGHYQFQLEFELRHAMVLPSSGNGYLLKPNGVRVIEAERVGTIYGNVDERLCGGDLSAAGIYLYPATATDYKGLYYDTSSGTSSGPVQTTLVQAPDPGNASYHYALHYVEAGTYDLALVCNAAEDNAEATTFEPSIPVTIQDEAFDPAALLLVDIPAS